MSKPFLNEIEKNHGLDFLNILESEADKLSTEIPDDESFKDIATLAYMQIDCEKLISKLEDTLERAKNKLKEISQRRLPDAMLNNGLSEFKLDDGSKISVKKLYLPHIKEENKEEAYNWLISSGNDIIKNNIELTFSKGNSEEAKKALNLLKDNGYAPVSKENIHWQTFRAWAKDALEKGVEIPEIIDIHIIDEAKIKIAK